MRARFHLRRGTFDLDVDFTAPDTGVTAVFGPSGSGKTTLLRCLAGLERPAGGLLEVAGELWQDAARGRFVPTHRRRVGYVFQDAGLFAHLSVRRNLEYGWRRTPSAERRVAFDEAVDWLGLAPLLERDPRGLSGGERQRVAIGRALLASPRLLLMDEPLAALDAAARHEILPYVERLHAALGIPILYVSHSAGEVLRLADHLLLLAGGRLRASGPALQMATRLDLLPWTGDGDAAESAAAGAPGATAAMAAMAAVAAVVEATVAAHDETYALTYLHFAGGTLSLPRLPALPGTRQRVRILANDVSLALDPPRRTSLLNILPARVVEIAADPAGQPLVKLDAGGTPLLARITRKSLATLDLHPGQELFALIKGVALLT